MELSERCIAQLEKENWPHIYEWQDSAGTIYPEHVHQGKVTLFVTDGSIEVTISSVARTLRTGDRLDVPPPDSPLCRSGTLWLPICSR